MMQHQNSGTLIALHYQQIDKESWMFITLLFLVFGLVAGLVARIAVGDDVFYFEEYNN